MPKTMLSLLAGAAMTVGLSGQALAATPSFACGYALTATEAAICDSDYLADLDLQMSYLYHELVDGGATPRVARQVRRSQIAWLKQRNRCRGDEVCIANAYERRIRFLGDLNGD